MKKAPHIFSFFSGSGFLDLGFEMEGFDIDLVNEISPSFMNAYKYSREKMGMGRPRYGYGNGDVNDYLGTRSNELKKRVEETRESGVLVGFIGGPPCPDFSIAGKQRGREGDNGKLSLSYVRLIVLHRPDFFLFENVKGLWRTAKHRQYYEELKTMLSESGYDLTERLTNALEFGVPQNRDRIFLFGIKRGMRQDCGKSLSDGFPWERHMKYSMEDIRRTDWPSTAPFVENVRTECPEGVPRELTVQHWFEKNDVGHHPNKGDCFIPRSGLARMQTVDEGDDSRKSYKRLHRWRYSPTVAYGNNEVHLHPYKPRRLNAAEAMALQSLPKEFALPPEMSLTDKFKTIGNGVPFLMSHGVARAIREYLQGRAYENGGVSRISDDVPAKKGNLK